MVDNSEILIIFDLDGVLVDARELHYEALNRALATIDEDVLMVLQRRQNWVAELKRLPEPRQDMALELLMQLGLPPRQRCAMLAGGEAEIVGTEVMGWFD